jgi:hypothetical protein
VDPGSGGSGVAADEAESDIEDSYKVEGRRTGPIFSVARQLRIPGSSIGWSLENFSLSQSVTGSSLLNTRVMLSNLRASSFKIAALKSISALSAVA